jgi:hypothetical protein
MARSGTPSTSWRKTLVLRHIRLLVVDGFSAFAGARLAIPQAALSPGGRAADHPARPAGSTRPVHRRVQPVIEVLLRELTPQVTELTIPPICPRKANIWSSTCSTPANSPNRGFHTHLPGSPIPGGGSPRSAALDQAPAQAPWGAPLGLRAVRQPPGGLPPPPARDRRRVRDAGALLPP